MDLREIKRAEWKGWWKERKGKKLLNKKARNHSTHFYSVLRRQASGSL